MRGCPIISFGSKGCGRPLTPMSLVGLPRLSFLCVLYITEYAIGSLAKEPNQMAIAVEIKNKRVQGIIEELMD